MPTAADENSYLRHVEREKRNNEKKCVSIYRICEHCNQEYFLKNIDPNRNGEHIVNFIDCPICGKRDDTWIRVEIKSLG